MPKVSVVVPVYNVEKHLNRCIDSIINQTYEDFELILIDDGSSDNSGAICDQYSQKDNRIRVMHKENGGASLARNCGIDNANGKFVMFVDSDDYIGHEMLKTHIDLMENDVDLTVTSLDVVDNGKTRKYCMPNKIYTVQQYFEDMGKKVYSELCASSPCCKFFRKSILEKYGIKYNTNMSLGEDTCFNTEYLKYCKKIVSSENVLYHYTKENDDSLFSRFQENTYKNVKKAFEHRIATLKQVGTSEETINNFTVMYIEYMLENAIKSVKKGTKLQAIAYMRQVNRDEYLHKKIANISNSKLRLLGKILQKEKCIIVIYYVLYTLIRIKILVKKLKS